MIYFVRHGQSTVNAGDVTIAHAKSWPTARRISVATLLDAEPVLILR